MRMLSWYPCSILLNVHTKSAVPICPELCNIFDIQDSLPVCLMYYIPHDPTAAHKANVADYPFYYGPQGQCVVVFSIYHSPQSVLSDCMLYLRYPIKTTCLKYFLFTERQCVYTYCISRRQWFIVYFLFTDSKYGPYLTESLCLFGYSFFPPLRATCVMYFLFPLSQTTRAMLSDCIY